MAETVEQYMERILGNVDGDPVAIQAATKPALDRLIGNVPVEKLRRRPSPDHWSVAEIVAHLLDAEIVASFRIRMILSEPGRVITAYDQEKWAGSLDYKNVDPVQALKQFGVLREMNVAVLSKLTEAEWERFGMHEERGKETLRQMVRMYAGHDVNHLKQIEAMVKAL